MQPLLGADEARAIFNEAFQPPERRERIATAEALGRVLSEMARQALNPSVQWLGRGASRFPAFEVPADARLIPASRAQKALDEDGIA